MRTTRVLIGLGLSFIFAFTSFASAEPERIHIPESVFDWENRVYFLMADSVSHRELADLVDDLNFSHPRHRMLSAFSEVEIEGASFLTQPVDDELQVDSWNPARQKLARIIFVDLSKSADPARIVTELVRSPEIEYAGIDRRIMDDLSSADCGGTTLIDQSGNFTKNWAMQSTRLGQLWSVARGHSYIGVIDLGVYHHHNELRDFSGSTYIGGNFHRHLSFDVGARFSDSGSGAHPFIGAAIFGEVDEYNAKVAIGQGPGYANCDALGGNSDGFNQLRFAGHGTHVAGLIAGRGANNFGWHGACRHCPLQIARFSHAGSCAYGAQPYTGMPYEANLEGSLLAATASMAFSVDIGVQILNYSGGLGGYSAGFCTSNPSNPMCLALKYATDRDVMIFTSSGNQANNSQHFPAIDPRVYGVSGIQPGGGFWFSGTGCGSNYGTSSSNGPSFSAPAKGVYSSMYPDMNYNPSSCHEYNDGAPGNGYGFCIGTSMSAPFLSGIAGVVRSINPLASRANVFDVMRETTNRSVAGQGYHNQFGWGVPRADDAAKKMLGVSGSVQVKNRLTPLFNLYSSVARDFANTTKPQVALAFATNAIREYDGYASSPLVAGYSFKESSGHPSPPQPRADVYILTTHVSPNQNAVRPLYRMRYLEPYGGNANNWDTVLVWQSEIQSFRSVGYNLEGMEGYVYQHCTPDCIPVGAVKLYRAYNPTDDDHAIFPHSRLTAMQNLGFTSDLKLLGYAYPNVDSDGDGLINGMEYILGTSPFSQDSNCNGIGDGYLYPPFGRPMGDPLSPNMC